MAALLRRLFLAIVRLYYPVIRAEGARGATTGAPTETPVLFVANHPNGLLDPLVLELAVGRPVRFLAKSTLFGNPAGRAAMATFGALPVYRTQDAGGRPLDPALNEATFARCREALGRGEAMALFPEGTAHSDPRLRPLKTGAARIALSAEAEHAGALGLTIVPVGLAYERKARFRSRVLAMVGEPLPVASELAAYRIDERATVDRLTERIEQGLGQVVLQAESRDLLEGVAAVASWTAADRGAARDLGAHHERALALAAAYARLKERDPARVEAITARAREYARVLRALGVRDPWALEVGTVRPRAAIAAALRLLITAPLALTGAVMGYAPYRLAGVVAARVTDEEDLLGTVKLIAGALFCSVAWIAEAAIVGHHYGWGLVPAVIAAGPSTGFVALRFAEVAARFAATFEHALFRFRSGEIVARLAARRRALADEVARALEEGGANAALRGPL